MQPFTTYIFNRDKWPESADVCCIRTNILPNCHAILHYFTLKDPAARGGVRPSCLAYITQDSTKLYRLRKDLTQAVTTSAQIFKHANMRWLAKHGTLAHGLEVYNEPFCTSFHISVQI